MVDLGKDRTRVALTGGSAALLVSGALAAGAALGVVLDPAAGWLAEQVWLPGQVVFDQADRFAGWAPLWAQLVAGVVAGVLGGTFLVTQATVVEVDDREVVVAKGATRRRVARSQVGAVVVEGRHLSLRDRADVDLVRESVDGDVDRLRDALRRHGWPVTP